MDFNSFALAVLLGLSTLLGVEQRPEQSADWQLIHDWQQTPTGYSLTAKYQGLSVLCDDSSGYVHFPLLIHGTHTIRVDNHLISKIGDSSFVQASNFYNQVFIPCSQLKGSELVWQAHSYSKYFAQFNFYPYHTAELPNLYLLTQASTYITSSMGLIVLGLFALIIFRRIFPTYLTLFCTGVAGWSVFFITMSIGGDYFGLSMLGAHKIADAGLWIGNTALLACFYLEGYLPKVLMKVHFFAVTLGLMIIAMGTDGNSVQLGTSLGFPSTIIATFFIFVSACRQITRKDFDTSNALITLIAVMAFSGSIFHDIILTAGLIDGGLFLPVGIFSAFFALALLIGQRMNSINEENRLLNASLSQEVRRQLELMAEQDQQAQKVQSTRLQWLEFMAKFLRHELKNSIAGIMTSLQLAKKSTYSTHKKNSTHKKDSTHKYIDRAMSACNNINALLSAVTDATSVESMIASAEPGDIDLSALIQERCDELSLVYADHTFISHITPSVSIIGNTQLLELLLDKIVNNAVEHSNTSSEITIEVNQKELQTELTVKNKGSSIPSDSQKLFDLSYSTKAQSGENFGIGLYLVKLIADFHNADVIAENVSDGVQFKVLFKPQYHPLLATQYSHGKR